MLNNRHFYHRTIRKNVVAFGDIFNDITLIRYENGTFNETSRLKVPLTYSGKENFLTRLLTRPDLDKSVQVVLPRMSFEMTSLVYDASRKLSIFNVSHAQNSSGSYKKLNSPVPYNINFELTLYTRNVEDGTQIVEQILPYFSPDYTITMTFVDGFDTTTRDVPIILNTVDYSPSYEGTGDTPRILIWTLTFTMKTYFYGPLVEDGGNIIRKAIANTYYYGTTSNNSPQWVYQSVEPDPIDAEPTEDYGFTEVTIEYFSSSANTSI
jgi:hypothetical protein